MMALRIPLKYNLRNLFVRKVTTTLTMLGIALVVAVFLCLMSLASGLNQVFTSSGSESNVIIIRKNAQSELTSLLNREQIPLVLALPSIERDFDGAPLAAPELIVILSLDREDGTPANVTMRGTNDKGLSLRPQMHLEEGRMFRPGMSEAIVSQKVARRFNNCEIGDTLHFGSAQWTVVGHFSAEGTAPDSEVWTDVQGLLSTFKRDLYSSILVRTPDRAARDEMIAAINADPRLTLDTRNERAYYDDQTVTSKPIQFLGMLVGVIMAIGACFGAMNTMYAAVAARAREVATLRVLGFSKPAILLSFATESVILSLAGGILGCLMGYAAIRTVLSGVSGTMNFVTFSEVVFTFDLNPGLVAQAMLFALLMGVLGGLFPAARAARTEITAALRQVA